jgi:hypothetical protein
MRIPRTRGRPPAFSPEATEIFRKLFPEITTARGLQGRQYATRAISILKDEPDAFVEFTYLIGPSAENPKFRFTILTELGRIHDSRMLVATARELCRQRIPSRLAVALIRQRVRRKGSKSPTLDATTRYIIRCLDEWSERYPDMDEGIFLEALNEAYGTLQMAMERKAKSGR